MDLLEWNLEVYSSSMICSKQWSTSVSGKPGVPRKECVAKYSKVFGVANITLHRHYKKTWITFCECGVTLHVTLHLQNVIEFVVPKNSSHFANMRWHCMWHAMLPHIHRMWFKFFCSESTAVIWMLSACSLTIRILECIITHQNGVRREFSFRGL
jgi:hypothetical protein